MDISFKVLEKKWNKNLCEIHKKLLINPKEIIPKDLSCALEYLTVKRIVAKKLKPTLIIINGPGGAGKTTIGKEVEKLGFQRMPRITDRPKRSSEIDGKDYHFVDALTFDKLYKEEKILAVKTTYGFHRGFLKETFNKLSCTDDLQSRYYTEGESSLKAFKEAQDLFDLSSVVVLNVFILPPSFKELFRRLSLQNKEGNFTEEEFNVRLKCGIEYLSKSITHFNDFDNSLFLVNNSLDRLASIFSFFAVQNDLQIDNDLITFLGSGNRLQGITTRNYAHLIGLLHPISVVYVFDSQGRLLIQRRANSGLWDHSVAGHLDIGESYQKAAHRELEEELGVSDVVMSFFGSGTMVHSLIPEKKRHHFNLFTCFYDGPFKIQTEEVLEIDYVSLENLKERFINEPKSFSGGFHATYEYYLRLIKK